MTTDASQGRQSRWWILVAAIAATVPLLAPAIPPLTDAPGHIGRYFLMLHGHEHPTLAAGYDFEWRLIGNLGVDLIVWVLGQAMPVETAARIATTAIPAVTVAGMLACARVVHGRIPPTAWFALPLAYAFPLQFGFLNYALAVGLAFHALALWLVLAERPGLRAALFVPIAVALYIAHLSGWAAFGLMAAGAEFARLHGRGWRRAAVGTVAACVPLSLPVAIALAGARDPHALTYDWFLWPAKLQWLVSILREGHERYDVLSVLLLFAVVALGARRLGMRGELALPALLCAAAFVILPRVLMNGTYADMRLAPVALALALLAIRPPASRAAARALAAAGIAFALMRLVVTTATYAGIARDQQRELAALDAIPDGASILALVARPCEAWATRRMDHIPSLAIPRRHAFVNSQWAIRGQQLVAIRRRDAAPYDHDPTQIVVPPKCQDAVVTEFGSAITEFNRAAFTHVWTIGIAPRRLTPDLRPVWSNGRSAVYAVARPQGATYSARP